MSEKPLIRPADISGTRALIADDSKAYRRMLRKMLEASRVDCEEASDGKEALAFLEKGIRDKNPFHLLFLDLNMPVLNGVDTLREVRVNRDLHTLPVIIISSESERNLVATCAHYGVSSYLVKPFNPARVLDAAGLALAHLKKDTAKKTVQSGPAALSAECVRELYRSVEETQTEDNPARDVVLSFLRDRCPWLTS